jgi:chromosome segregation ATPase
MGGGSVRARATVGFGPWDEEALEERIERLRRAIESHEQQLGDLDSRFDDEERSRREADEQHERRVNEVERELTELIREAAAGGLRLETIGVSLFALGVVLQTAGSLAAS